MFFGGEGGRGARRVVGSFQRPRKAEVCSALSPRFQSRICLPGQPGLCFTDGIRHMEKRKQILTPT